MGYSRAEVLDISQAGSSTLDLSSDFSSDTIKVEGHTKGSVQINWTGIDAFNSTIILQGSDDETNWNDLGGDTGGIILLNTPDSQVWEFTTFTTRYIRVSYQANSVTEGIATGIVSLKRDS